MSDYSEINQKMKITNAQAQSGVIPFELRLNGMPDHKDGKYLVVFNNNTSTDDRGSLTLGGNSWYYGGNEQMDKYNNGFEYDRGIINASNDFSKAFIVASNSKNLYNKIGHYNGEKTIKLDRLTAIVLFIPGQSEKKEVVKLQDTTMLSMPRVSMQV
ncbi:hypothetical protein [Streptococcus catagoni]|uniref:hypothetical protein n=1 Tax=Streptococcus catagoni TaxID=2654874 RepID=UPI00140A92B5|nr:hypothetical protein [Streptococcus catagoni]